MFYLKSFEEAPSCIL